MVVRTSPALITMLRTPLRVEGSHRPGSAVGGFAQGMQERCAMMAAHPTAKKARMRKAPIVIAAVVAMAALAFALIVSSVCHGLAHSLC